MGIQTSGNSAIDEVRKIKEVFPDYKYLSKQHLRDDDRVYESIVAGASGYILKAHLKESIANAIQELNADGAPMNPLIARKGTIATPQM